MRTIYFAGAAIAALVFAAVSNAEAKGPGGAIGSPPPQAAASSNGLGSNTWSTPPGWGKAEDSKGWDGGTSPPGWDDNTTGQAKGWDGALPPGIEKRQPN